MIDYDIPVGILVIDKEKMFPPRRIVMAYSPTAKKKIKALLGSRDGQIIFLTDYNKDQYISAGY